MLPWPSRVLVTNPDRQLPCHFSKTVLRIPSKTRISPLGSPPRGRGKDERKHGLRRQTRITPAWAGKRTLHRFHRLACRDHPRMGGEKAQVLPAGISSEGSPPRGRGKGVSNVLVPEKFGITPAWAGKSRYRCRCWSGGRDHPRMGGEKPFLFYGGSSDSGSPPHGRGKVHSVFKVRKHHRITPAWAGKSRRPGLLPG